MSAPEAARSARRRARRHPRGRSDWRAAAAALGAARRTAWLGTAAASGACPPLPQDSRSRVRPERWLMLLAPAAPGTSARAAGRGVRWHSGAVVELSSGLDAFYLAGARARELLRRGCRLDLAPGVFAAGCAAATYMAQVAVTRRGVPRGLLLLTPASTARSLARVAGASGAALWARGLRAMLLLPTCRGEGRHEGFCTGPWSSAAAWSARACSTTSPRSAGRDVLLLEKSELTSGSTWHAAGGMHTFNGEANISRLQKYTIDLYREIEALSGQSCGLHPNGGLMLAATDGELDSLRLICSRARYLGMETEMISLDAGARAQPAHRSEPLHRRAVARRWRPLRPLRHHPGLRQGGAHSSAPRSSASRA